jgi:cathepsin B
MLKIVIIGTIAAFTQAASLGHKLTYKSSKFIKKEDVEAIKAKAKTWVPFEVDENPLKDKTEAQLKALLGALPEDDEDDIEDPTGADYEPEVDILDPQGAYTPFDSRTQWGSCIKPVMNQGSCGSCWAFATTEVVSDRLCIATKGAKSVVVSPQHLLNCDTRALGCSGGYPNYAMTYMASYGAPSATCVPYTNKKQTCGTKCTSTATTNFTKYKCKTGSAFTLTSITDQMNNIRTYGPLEATFTVYSDFYNYRSGIYSYVSGSNLGGHAVEVVGWGNTNGVDYWIVKNSWGTSWGEAGYFRIKFGQVGFGKTMWGCYAQV